MDGAQLGSVGSANGVPLVRIHSRRYLGAKTRLLSFLDEVVAEVIGPFQSFADLFAGTGVVAHHFNRPGVRIVASDLLACNVVSLRAFLGTTSLDRCRYAQHLETLQRIDASQPNYFSEHFGGTYFSLETARHIGAIRERIDAWQRTHYLSPQEVCVLLTSLLYAADKVANTCGHYDAFRLSLDRGPNLKLQMPEIDWRSNAENLVIQGDANAVALELDVDVLYLDPPYNSRQYSDSYHLLENLVRWERPPVEGKARKMDRQTLKSDYCSMRRAGAAFSELVSRARARHILVSYNNMGDKGDPRSNACISDETIMEALESRGSVQVFERPFSHFSAGLRAIESHTERLFYCRVLR